MSLPLGDGSYLFIVILGMIYYWVYHITMGFYMILPSQSWEWDIGIV